MTRTFFTKLTALAMVLILPSASFAACGHANDNTAKKPKLPKETKLTIREILDTYYKGETLYIGCATHNNIADRQREESAALRREFSYITPANDFKQTEVHPDAETWSWDQADRWIPFARDYRQIIRVHGPISPQCSKWAKDDSRTPEELEQNLREFMTALCKRYNGVEGIRWMDVINETITVKPTVDEVKGDGKVVYKVGDWYGPLSGTRQFQMPWTHIGTDDSTPLKTPRYIDIAFEIANREAPDILQIINQNGQLEEPVVEKLKALVTYLRNVKGRRVDGIGWQAHIDLGWEKVPGNVERLAELINWCHANKLEFHITEFNIWAKPEEAELLNEQAETFAKVVETVVSKRHSGIVGINFWFQRTGGSVSHGIVKCAMWNKDGSPRPAYDKVKQVLLEEAGR